MLYPVLQDPLHPIVSSLFDRPRGASIGQMLFGAGEQGGWYDVSDMSTLFQDAAGTTPVTAVEQPVGRILDKSGRGNHATQATATKRPALSRRVNWLTKTEDFQNAAWVTPPSGTVKSNDAGADPLGGGTAGKVECTQAGVSIYAANSVTSLITGATYRVTVHTRNGVGVPSIILYNGQFGAYKSATISLITGAVTASNYTTPPVVSVASDGWVTISVDIVAPDTGGNYCYVQASAPSAVGDHFFIWHPSLTLAIDAHLPYQWVNTATDYDADPAKFPAYLRFDGVDDALQAGNIDFTSTDKMTVWAGVTKLSDAGLAVMAELSNGAVDGAISLQAPFGAASPSFLYSSRGSTARWAATVAYPSPSTAVLTGVSDISGDVVSLRVNAIVVATITTDHGVGNYGNYPLHIGARSGLGNYFKGRLYSLIVRGAQTPLSQIQTVESYIKQKMRLP